MTRARGLVLSLSKSKKTSQLPEAARSPTKNRGWTSSRAGPRRSRSSGYCGSVRSCREHGKREDQAIEIIKNGHQTQRDPPRLHRGRVERVCRGIADGPDSTFEECITSEPEVRDQLVKVVTPFRWWTKSIVFAEHWRTSELYELITCLEMARDVRELHSTDNKKRH